jgi:hypothetical protein
VNIPKMEVATTVALAPITTYVTSEPIARWGFHLKVTLQNTVVVLCLNGAPSHSTFSFFSNTLFSDGRTVAHAQGTTQVSKTEKAEAVVITTSMLSTAPTRSCPKISIILPTTLRPPVVSWRIAPSAVDDVKVGPTPSYPH